MEIFDVVIIGGGAAGSFCAIRCAKRNKKVLLIDKANLIAKKLLVTGNGRCNLSNLNIFPTKNYYNLNIDKFIEKLSPLDTINLFNQMGLVTFSDNEKRVYPITNSAKSVVDVINNEIKRYDNLSISLNTTVLNFDKKDKLFVIKTDKGEFFSKKLVIATGGKTFENELKKLKIRTRAFCESLVSLKTQSTKILSGLRVSPAKISVVNSSFSQIGEILFKDDGISGIASFNISSYFARKNDFSGQISVDLMPNISNKNLFLLLEERKELNLPINKMFDGLLLPQIGYFILNRLKINENRTTKELSREEIQNICQIIKNLNFNVSSHHQNNQIYSGGVLLSELNENLEAKHIKNLYFCGEICDVDGICGGYNLQWAWTSGFIVGENI